MSSPDTTRALLEAIADEIGSAKCDSLLPASLIAWERNLRQVASSLEGHPVAVGDVFAEGKVKWVEGSFLEHGQYLYARIVPAEQQP